MESAAAVVGGNDLAAFIQVTDIDQLGVGKQGGAAAEHFYHAQMLQRAEEAGESDLLGIGEGFGTPKHQDAMIVDGGGDRFDGARVELLAGHLGAEIVEGFKDQAQAVTSGKLNKCVARFKCAYTPFSPTPQPREKDDRASYPRAWSRSRIKSSTDSSPTDKRITSGPAPAAKSCSSFNWRWVVEAG